MNFGKSYWYDYAKGCEREWLLTNGKGGYASLSLICSNSRRYHGLLVSAQKPPTDRQLLLSNVLEVLSFQSGNVVSLSSFITVDGYISNGFHQLQHVDYELLPEFTYCYRDIIIKKKIAMKYGENTTVVQYEIKNGAEEVTLKLSPLVNYRDHHHKSQKSSLRLATLINKNELSIYSDNSNKVMGIWVSDGELQKLDDCFFYNMFYLVEHERGLDSTEDHYMPGTYSISLKPSEHKIINFVVTSEDNNPSSVNVQKIIFEEEQRLIKLLNKVNYKDKLTKRLVMAADNFIVKRASTNSKTVIAGYPWFTDWGRDTMIAFSGLTLSTGRFEDAREILYTFSKYVNYGLIPNMFPDDGEQPAYNSVDAALWYFEAVNNYLNYTQDYEFIRDKIYPCLKNICSAFVKGTIYDIKMAEDGLVTAGNKRTQLTWMDAKVGDWVVTPRHGKAVEINALWYNALVIMSQLSDKFSEKDQYALLAEKVRNSFELVFWNDQLKCLYDVVNEEGKDASLRPNQIMAVGLSNPVLDGFKAKSVVEKVWQELYTPYGLRSLSQNNPQYKGIYSGDVWKRDGAYHQGTVWTWLLGRFIKAFIYVNGNSIQARETAKNFMIPFIDHMQDGGLGNISEIFDGNNPYYPRGCFAQAWSVAEILRAAVEDVRLEDKE